MLPSDASGAYHAPQQLLEVVERSSLYNWKGSGRSQRQAKQDLSIKRLLRLLGVKTLTEALSE